MLIVSLLRLKGVEECQAQKAANLPPSQYYFTFTSSIEILVKGTIEGSLKEAIPSLVSTLYLDMTGCIIHVAM